MRRYLQCLNASVLGERDWVEAPLGCLAEHTGVLSTESQRSSISFTLYSALPLHCFSGSTASGRFPHRELTRLRRPLFPTHSLRAGTIALARFHARFRGATRTDPDLAGEWLRKQDDRKYYALVKKAYAKAAKAVTIPDVEGGPEIKEFGLEFVRYFDGWLESAIQSPIPMTLMHGDARGENFFFDAPLTGPVEGQAGSGDTVRFPTLSPCRLLLSSSFVGSHS